MDVLNAFYLICVLIVACVSLAIGFRKGLTSQVGAMLGMAFGAVGARILSPEFVHHFSWTARLGQAPEFNEICADLACSIAIYCIIFWVVSLISPVLRIALSVIEIGIFNRMLGALFTMLKNLLWLSILLNILICFSSRSGLLRFEKANDGNLVAAVMALTPAILGCYGAEDFAHFHQLKEAKTISCNFNAANNVILTEGQQRLNNSKC